MKIAAYNVENLFDRAKIFNEPASVSQEILKKEAALNTLFEKSVYTAADKTKILQLLTDLGIKKTDEGPYAILRKLRGKLLNRPKTGAITVAAGGRADWVGWVELKTAHVNNIAIMNTGQVLRDVNADIVAVVEAENRIALKQFCDHVLAKVGGTPYAQVMLIDGNDLRGIDVGLLTRNGYPITNIRTHIHDLDGNGKPIYSRDCPEYCVVTPTGEKIWVLPNHFKSKFGGNDPSSQKKRLAQAERTAAIYAELTAAGEENVVILGDLNDTPASAALQPLLTGTTLQDISAHPTFDTGQYKGTGTFGPGTDGNKIDYMLLSPALFARIKACGIFRKGAYPGKRPKWEVYPELKEEVHAASDHHLVWCEIE